MTAKSFLIFFIALSFGCKKSEKSSVKETSLLEVTDAEANNEHLSTVLLDLKQAAGSFAISDFKLLSHVQACFSNATLAERAKPLIAVFQGFVVDGVGGDLCFVKDAIYYCGKESIRTILSINPFGRMLLQARGSRTSEQVLYQGATWTWNASTEIQAFISDHGQEMAEYAYRLSQDKSFQAEQALKILNLSLILGSNIFDFTTRSTCEEISSTTGRVSGFVTYQVGMIVGLGVLTAELAGVGAGPKIVQFIASLTKLGSKLPKLRPLVLTMKNSLLRFAKASILKRNPQRLAQLAAVDAGKLGGLYKGQGIYHAVYDILEKLPMGRHIRSIFVKGLPQETNRIIDLGCGTGLVGEAATGRFAKVSIEGIDQSTDMLKLAKSRGYVNTIESNLLETSTWLNQLKPGLSDAAVMNMVSYFFKSDELVKIFSALATRIKKEGVLIVSFLDKNADGSKFITFLKNELKSLDGIQDADKIKFLQANIDSVKNGMNTYSAAEVAEIAQRSGFKLLDNGEEAYDGFARVYRMVKQ